MDQCSMRLLVRAILAGPFAVGVFVLVGCADIWGFQDAVALRDGGLDGANGAQDDVAAQGGCACLPPPPDPWQGPDVLLEGNGAPSPSTACDGDYPTAVFDGFAAPGEAPAVCSCSCGPPTGTCSLPVAKLFKDNLCSKPCAPDMTVGAACAAFDMGCGGGVHVLLGASEPTGGACAPQPIVTVGPAPWTESALVCGASAPLPSGACAAGDVCAPAPSGAFEADTYCAVRLGSWTCPATTYTVPHTYYAAADDTRMCSPCTCDAPIGGSCASATASTSMSMMCGPPTLAVPLPSGCITTTNALFAGAVPTGGTCAAKGGEPGGNFAPKTPWTVCCTR
jgi:hypothetical protein